MQRIEFLVQDIPTLVVPGIHIDAKFQVFKQPIRLVVVSKTDICLKINIIRHSILQENQYEKQIKDETITTHLYRK